MQRLPKNREIADFSLASGTPDINIIDEPLPPLEPNAMSLLIELIKGGLLGGSLAFGIFYCPKDRGGCHGLILIYL